MSIRNLDKIFSPRRVAVIGASDAPGKVGHTVFRNLIDGGFSGDVVPVNAARDAVAGRPTVRALALVDPPADLAVICTPAASVPDLIRECGRAGTMGVIVISAGFRETGAAGHELEEQVRAAAAEFSGLRIIGPNCLGAMAPWVGLNASFAADCPRPGRVAFLSQSGALCTSALDWAADEGIGFSLFVSLGNMIDVGLADLLDYLADDPHTDAAILYVESIPQAREFMSAARGFTRTKPIIAYKAGRFEASAKAAASHTGALAGVDAVYDAAFARAGIVRAYEVGTIFDGVELLARRPSFSGDRLAIVTNAGGPGVMALDALLEQKGRLAELASATRRALDECLPTFWSHGNPIDVLGDASPERFGRALEIALADPAVDAALVILTPQAMTDPLGTAERVVAASRASHKPVLASWMGGRRVAGGERALAAAGVPTFDSPERAVRAYRLLVEYAQRREILYETPRAAPIHLPAERRQAMERVAAPSPSPQLLSELDAKALLEAYGIPTTRTLPAASADEAARAARSLGYPVVLKILSPDITHKSDVGGVALNLSDEAALGAAFERLTLAARSARPDARIDGVSVQPMAAKPHARELLLGARRDPVFGAVMLVGMGGVAAEVLHDRALELPPLNERLARRMLESLRSWPLLLPFRGKPGAAIDDLVETLLRFSYLISDHPQIQEFDVNPLLASPDGVVAVDARAVLSPVEIPASPGPFPHLAIRPYPAEWERSIELRTGQIVLVRPLRPEDEPAWHELLRSCSPATLWSRFRHAFKETTHEMAARFCFIDYDREMALCAQATVDGRERLIGIGRLVRGTQIDTAEFAVLVADAWQGRGLGGALTDLCAEVGRQWGIQQIVAETTPMNTAMLATFRHRGFDCRTRDDVVICIKDLAAPIALVASD